MAIKTGKDLAAAAEAVARNYKTLYVLGCFGAPMNEKNKERYRKNQSYNRQPTRTVKIKAASADTFGFDCVCLIKALLWGWTGNQAKTYGGAAYASNNVPDINADQMIRKCTGVSTNFSTIQVGEVVHMTGHIGVYIGNGLAVECTHKWADGVQITAVHNIGKKAGYNGRKWTKHGKLPYVTYETTPAAKPATKPATGATNNTKEVCNVDLPVLKKGSKGETVKAMQQLLLANGYKMENKGKVYGTDGSFGAATENALRDYQHAKGLEVDGKCGPKTWSSLLGLL